MRSRISLRVLKAIERATELHYHQKRKGDGQPFIVHPFSTLYILLCYTDDEDTLAAGILHDVTEDVSQSVYSRDDMKREFGQSVLQTVVGASENKNAEDSPQKKKATWEKRKREHLKRLSDEPYETLMVVCADKIHNLYSLIDGYQREGEKYWERFNASGKKMMWYFRATCDLLKEKLESPIVLELEELISKAELLVK